MTPGVGLRGVEHLEGQLPDSAARGLEVTASALPTAPGGFPFSFRKPKLVNEARGAHPAARLQRRCPWAGEGLSPRPSAEVSRASAYGIASSAPVLPAPCVPDRLSRQQLLLSV